MKYLKRFNESVQNVKELELNDDMMVQTSMILNLIPNPYDKNIDKLGALIKTSLDEEVFLKLFSRWRDDIRDYKDVFIFFVTSVIGKNLIKKMFNNVTTQEGADCEEEFVSALEINGKIVLILHSPERGSSLRIQDDNHTIKFEEVLSIVDTLCKIYNERLK
jgi:hypothetical protein